jgi:ATP-dependent Clp protease ATP-binding subunit ClpB
MELEQARREGNFAKAGELQYSRIPELEQKLPKDEEAASGGSRPDSLLHDSVTADDIASVVSRTTGIPLSKLNSGEVEKLIHMEDTLRQFVKGQDEALTAVANAIRLQRAGLSGENRPIASFMMLGKYLILPWSIPVDIPYTANANLHQQVLLESARQRCASDLQSTCSAHRKLSFDLT